ncbi:hypothetical protein NBRC110019_29130 [Neptunitalea chrysea]|uniref:Phosphatidic acid phosphatase type 2/haloperoxidase domain-containing protein n=1 Tax=Neptunitalea chrysea TaxID=1647581 RepID=A0A9W6EWG8_9FLAO|nr:phosphatase PAP2 family protein [Neptunitalea chrysea]GLB53872.1 hypothetical protein NBRC110019_29130 [Neptunitalea chrysea]
MLKYIPLFLLFVYVHSYSQIDSLLVPEQNPEKQSLWQRFTYDGLTAYQGIKYAYSRPFHWKEKDFLTAGAFIGSEVILYSLDTNLNTFFSEQDEHAPHMLKQIGWYSGSPQNAYIAMGSFYLTGLFTNNQKIRRTGVLMITAGSAAGLLQTFSKTIVGRARPKEGLGKHAFDPFSKAAGFHSFPSGHSILTFTIAHSLAKQFDNIWVKSGIYSVGLIAPLSRLWDGAHWATDVTTGIVLSIVTVDAVDKFLFAEEKYNVPGKKKLVSWHFKAGYGTIGVVGVF